MSWSGANVCCAAVPSAAFLLRRRDDVSGLLLNDAADKHCLMWSDM